MSIKLYWLMFIRKLHKSVTATSMAVVATDIGFSATGID